MTHSSICIRGGKVLLDDWVEADVMTDGPIIADPGLRSAETGIVLDIIEHSTLRFSEPLSRHQASVRHTG